MREGQRKMGCRYAVASGLVVLSIGLSSTGCAVEAPAPERPNLILVSIDTLRAISPFSYDDGNEVQSSPSGELKAAQSLREYRGGSE